MDQKIVTCEEIIKLLEPLAKKHGIKFQKMKQGAYWPQGSNVHPAPFSDHLGIILPNIILYREGVQETSIIHEMGHLLFGLNGDEYKWFGWEWSIARLIGVEDQWLSENSNYVVSYPDDNSSFVDLGDVGTKDLILLFEDRIDAAQNAGIKIPKKKDLI